MADFFGFSRRRIISLICLLQNPANSSHYLASQEDLSSNPTLLGKASQFFWDAFCFLKKYVIIFSMVEKKITIDELEQKLHYLVDCL